MNKATPAFLTGSRIYGTPDKDSDYDLVILISRSDYWKLSEIASPIDPSNHPSASEDEAHPPLYFQTKAGELNLIVAFQPEIYQAWLDARDACIAEKPVTRDRAIQIHDAFKERAEAEVKARKSSRKPAVPRIKKDIYVPKQGGPVSAIRNTHYCHQCKSTPCRCT